MLNRKMFTHCHFISVNMIFCNLDYTFQGAIQVVLDGPVAVIARQVKASVENKGASIF